MESNVKVLLEFCNKNILIVAIVSASVLGFVIPEIGQQLYDLNFIPALIFTVFLCQGTSVESSKLKEWKHYLKGLTLGFVVSQVLAPILAYFLMSMVDWQEDYVVGFFLISCMAPTLVSGTVLTQQAKGDTSLAIVLTVILNILAVFTLPINLKLTLGKLVEVPSGELFYKLFFFVFVPSVIGYFVRIKKTDWVKSKKTWVKYIPIVCLSLPIFMSTAKQVERIKAAFSYDTFLSFAGFSLIEHLLLFIFAFYVASKLFKLPMDRCRALAIVSSQKTIPITIAVWSSVFAESYPMALVPAIIFHFCQIYADGIITNKWGKK